MSDDLGILVEGEHEIVDDATTKYWVPTDNPERALAEAKQYVIEQSVTDTDDPDIAFSVVDTNTEQPDGVPNVRLDPDESCDDCKHEIHWDWGETRPAKPYVVVPGLCPNCGERYERHYEFDEVIQA